MCGTELWNRARLSAYMANGLSKAKLLCPPCDGLAELIPCLDDAPPEQEAPIADGYQLPELDPAPWYDPAAPESMNFAGLLVLETKLSPAVDRRMVQNVGHGATLTPVRFEGRTLYVRGLLIGKTCCAAEYGLRWLTQALLGNYCSACNGCSITFSTCTPSQVDDTTECLIVTEEGGARVPYFRETEDDEFERGTDFVRQMHNAGLLKGPEVLGYQGGSCGSCGCAAMTEVEFTIGIGNPWLHRVEELVVTGTTIGGCLTEDCVIIFDDDPSCISDECAPGDLCADDPDCDLPNPPPLGRLPFNQCGCVPLVSQRNCFAVPADREWFEQTLIIEVHAGSEELRNVVIRAWQNPAALNCCAEESQSAFEDCAACATLLVGYVPANGILRFDSSVREVTITCANVTTRADRNVATVTGQPFEWIELGCTPACVAIDIDCGHTAADATASIWRVGREL